MRISSAKAFVCRQEKENIIWMMSKPRKFIIRNLRVEIGCFRKIEKSKTRNKGCNPYKKLC